MASFLRQGASLTASVLEFAAGALRKLAATDDSAPSPEREPERTPKPAVAEAAPAAATPKQRPAPATRTRISNPKAARKVRARQG